MALYVFDGTGNEDREGELRDSNALKFFDAYDDPKHPEKNHDPDEKLGSLYLKGVGTRARTFLGKSVAEAFGLGGHHRVRQALDRLEHNIDADDKDVDIAGFSRGAALALSFANEIASKMKDVHVRYIGLFDVVGQFGLPGEHVNAGHNLHMPPNVTNVYHAMALDETRLSFPLTRLGGTGHTEDTRLQEVWFRGVHSDIGGGNENASLNGIALNWLFQNAKRCGLPIKESAVLANLATIKKPPLISAHKIDVQLERQVRDSDLLHSSVLLGAAAGAGHLNDPKRELSRIDDLGAITKPQALRT